MIFIRGDIIAAVILEYYRIKLDIQKRRRST